MKNQVNNNTNGSKYDAFFSSITTGEKGVSKKTYVPVLDVSSSEYEGFMEKYVKFTGNFDNHIATSIPSFREVQVIKGTALSNLGGTATILDIGGSEGSFIKAVVASSPNEIKAVIVDPNPDMKTFSDSKPVEGVSYEAKAYIEGWEGMETFQSDEKFDIVHESMVFQFMNNQRESQIDHIIANNLANDGVLFLEEKFYEDSLEWALNEGAKNRYKEQYYDKAELTEKSREILEGMHKNQISYSLLEEILEARFTFVYKYWDAGNFKGYFATNSFDKYYSLLGNIGTKGFSIYSQQ